MHKFDTYPNSIQSSVDTFDIHNTILIIHIIHHINKDIEKSLSDKYK